MRATIPTPGLSVLVFALLAATAAVARGPAPPKPMSRDVFVGRISMMPRSSSGFWRIASRQITTDEMTQIVTSHGPLHVGSCAEVEMSRERVLRIESLSPIDC